MRRALPALALAIAIAGCGKETTKPSTPYVNSVKPTSNARITSQVIVGDAGNKTQLNQVERFDDGSFGFYGPFNASLVVGILEAGGMVRWTKTVSYFPQDILPLPATAIVPRGLLVLGVEDVNHDGTYETGCASLYSSTGTLLGEIAEPSPGQRLYEIAAVNDSEFVGCGLDDSSGVARPFLQRVNVHSPDSLAYGSKVTLTGVPGYFIQIAVVSASPSELVLAAAARPSDTDRNLHGLRASWPAFDAVTMDWTHAIVPPSGPWRGLTALALSAGNLYVVGYAADNGRPPDGGGEAWSSGVAASYTTAGAERWVKTVNLSQYADAIYSVAVGSGELYVAGEAASFVHSGTDWFGYGLVSKLDPNDGHVIANFTAGDENYSAGFFSGLWTGGGQLICGGWTQYDQDGGPYRGWLATMDISGTTPVAAARAREPIEPMARARPRPILQPMADRVERSSR